MQRYSSSWVFGVGLLLLGLLVAVFWSVNVLYAGALNIHEYKDTINNSAPEGGSNHTFSFEIKQGVPAGGNFHFEFPADFYLSTSSLNARNVELYVNGAPRTASDTLSATLDQVVVTSGAGGTVTYNLNSTSGIAADSDIEIRIGNHTSTALQTTEVFATSTGTTTVPGDGLPITNPDTIGTKEITMTVGGTAETTYADFLISIVTPIRIEGVDTTEEIPPYRFNGAPTSTVGGTTLFVEISLETDEFAICRWANASGTAYAAMPNTFANTGIIFHRDTVAITPDAFNTYFVRCVDDEGNFNTDDYVIEFFVTASPSGQSNADGSTEGDGTGSGNEGSGDGSGSGGSTGDSDGGESTAGSSSGGGGGGSGGGGGGGGRGEDDSDSAGGGFESSDDAYPSGDAEVIIRGYAFPGSTVYALVDGTISESVRANNNGSYSITIEAISRGVYTFGVYAVDADGNKSTTFSTSFTVTGGKTSNLSNINIMPTIEVNPDPVNIGTTITFSGYSIPSAEVTIETQKDGSSVTLKTYTTTSDGNGEWSIDVETNGFSAGTYKVRAKAVGTLVNTDYSNYTYYGVGQSAATPLNADLNRDGKVNLTDFSILLFWWGGDGGNSNPPADINQDGSVSLTDFSILLFNWTG